MKESEDWTPLKLVNWVSDYLAKNDMPPPHRFEAEQLVSHALELSRFDLYLNFDRPCNQNELLLLRQLLQRRLKREPLYYILQSCEFWSLELEIGSGVLIPRQDTETLIENALELIPEETSREEAYQILELGTGSGAIPLAISSERRQLVIITVERFPEALACAQKNFQKYAEQTQEQENEIVLIQGNLFNTIKNEPQFDLIVSNPPYIEKKDMEGLQPEVRDWEPYTALEGGDDGLDFYRYLKKASGFLLKAGGHLLVEHGYNQGETLKEMFEADPLFELRKQGVDLPGNCRTTLVQKIKS